MREEQFGQWDGGLTVSADGNGADSYDFGSRAALVSIVKSELRLPELMPLPSPWTLEIQPTLLCNARCHFCSYDDLITAFRHRQRTLPPERRSLGMLAPCGYTGRRDRLRHVSMTLGNPGGWSCFLRAGGHLFSRLVSGAK